MQYSIQYPGCRLPSLPPNSRTTRRRRRRRSKRHPIPRDSHILRLCDVGSRGSARVLLSRVWLVDVVVLGVDLEEVVEDDHEHGAGAEEEGETVEVVVGDHFGVAVPE